MNGRSSLSSKKTRLRSPLTTLGLFALALALLYVGNFIQFDDTSGFGSDTWVLPVGVLGVLAAIASVIVAQSDLMARRLLGWAMLVLDILVIWQATTDDGFRFIWGGDEGELFYLQVGLGMTALLLLATTRGQALTDSTAGAAATLVIPRQSLFASMLDNSAQRVIIALLALSYTLLSLPYLAQSALAEPLLLVSLGVGLACGWAASRAATRPLATTLGLLAPYSSSSCSRQTARCW